MKAYILTAGNLLKLLLLEEFAHNLLHVAMLTVDGVVETAHVFVGDFPGELIQRVLHFGVTRQRFLANDGHGLVGRKIMFVVVQHEQVQRRNEAVGGVSCNQIYLLISQGPWEKTEIHHSWWLCEPQAVGAR